MNRFRYSAEARTSKQVTTCLNGCRLQQIPPQIFGELVLRLLGFKDLCAMDVALSESNLREYWWKGAETAENPSVKHLDVCLRHAIDPRLTITVTGNAQIIWFHKRGMACCSYRVGEMVDDDAFKLLLETPELVGLQLYSLVVDGYLHRVKLIFYLKAIAECKYLLSLDLASSEVDLVDSCYDIINNNPHLVTLILTGAILQSFSPSFKYAKALRHLVVNTDMSMSFRSPEDLIPLRGQLETFSMTQFTVLSRPIINALFNHHELMPMREVVLSQRNTAGTFFFFMHIDDDIVRKVAKNCPLLELLDISAEMEVTEGGFIGTGQVTDTAVVSLAQHCVRLRKLSIALHTRVTSAAIEQLLTLCPHLTYIDLFATTVTKKYIRSREAALLIEGRVVIFHRKYLCYSSI